MTQKTAKKISIGLRTEDRKQLAVKGWIGLRAGSFPTAFSDWIRNSPAGVTQHSSEQETHTRTQGETYYSTQKKKTWKILFGGGSLRDAEHSSGKKGVINARKHILRGA